jgi:hypothetical protein
MDPIQNGGISGGTLLSTNLSTIPSYLNNAAYLALPHDVQETYVNSFTTQQLDSLFAALPVAQTSGTTLNDYFKTIVSSITDLQHQLQASELVDQKTQNHLSQAAVLQAEILAASVEAYNQAAASVGIIVDTAIADFTTDVNSIQQGINTQNTNINNFNAINNPTQQDIDNYNASADSYNNTYADPNNSNSFAAQIIAVAKTVGLSQSDYASLLPPIAPHATSGSTLSTLTYSPVNPQSLKNNVQQSLNQSVLGPLQAQNDQLYSSWAFSSQQILYFTPENTAVDPLSNTKKLTKKLFPDSYVNSQAPIEESAPATGVNSLTGVGVQGASHILNLLSKALTSEVLSKYNTNVPDQKIQKVADSLYLFTQSLIKTSSFQSILPSLVPLSEVLANLPSNSPVYALLFSISFANRTLETSSVTPNTLQSFIESQIPELKGISKENLANISAAVNLGLLLTSLSLIAKVSGVPGLSQQLVQQILPPNLAATAISQAAKENAQELESQQSKLKQFYLNQGFAQQEAEFLTQFATNVVQNNVTLAPTLTSVSANNIQEDLLKQSLQANLIFSGYQQDEANKIANQAVDRALNNLKGKTVTAETFKESLELALRRQAVGKERVEIAQNAFLLPATTATTITPTEKNQIPVTTNQPITASTNQLTPDQIVSAINNNVSQILTGQIGAKLNKTITEQLAISLFGTSNPDSKDVANVKSINSLVNTTKDQLNILKTNDNTKFTEKVVESFKETMKDNTQLSSFLENLLNPYSLFVHSISGIMYSGLESTKADKTISPRV